MYDCLNSAESAGTTCLSFASSVFAAGFGTGFAAGFGFSSGFAVAGFSGLLFYFGKNEEFNFVIQSRLTGLITNTASSYTTSYLAS